MEAITRAEMFLAVAAGDADAPEILPTPETRIEHFLSGLCNRIANLGIPSSEEIQTAVNAYLGEHPATGRAATDEEFWEVINDA